VIHDFGVSGDAFAAGQSWDLCIVGAGAAGLALASEFLGTPWRVVVLESGLRDPDARGEDLNALDSVGLRHDGWRDGRVRCLGGTTRAWGGQLIPMRASELQSRPWIPDSGWPLALEELEPYYRRVERLLQIEGPPYDGTVWERLRIAPPALDSADFCVRFSQWAALGRRNFAVLWRRELERSRNVSVLLDATTIAVECAPGGGRCEAMGVRSRSGREGRVRARWYVIACGGIETARLLLASPTSGGHGVPNSGNGGVVNSAVANRGVANSSGLVGRFFQDHVSYVAGEVEPASRKAVQNLFDPRYVGSTMYSVKVEPSDAAMRREGWLNAMAHIAFQIPDALGWMELRRILRSLQAGRLELPSRDEALAMLRGSAELTRLVLTRYLANRRRSPDAGKIRLLIDSEQAPNGDSRVLLDTRVDALGMTRARLDWRITDLERRTLTGFAQSIATEFERLGLGKIRLAGAPDFESRDEPGAARDIFHHMGTTRMSTSARSGVTRPDLRCHDVDNLFVAGAAVFPTGGIANPTFTALALSLRLADHLKAAQSAA
jgi:choline dehydrogenase-like flavoprotein